MQQAVNLSALMPWAHAKTTEWWVSRVRQRFMTKLSPTRVYGFDLNLSNPMFLYRTWFLYTQREGQINWKRKCILNQNGCGSEEWRVHGLQNLFMLKDETSKLCCKTFPLILKGLTNPINHYKKRNRKASLIETIVKIEDQILASRKKKIKENFLN